MSISLVAIDDHVAISGQLQPQDMKEIAAAGYVAVVNNRPDGEAMFGQPRTAELRKAAEEAGLLFLDLPFSGQRATADQVRAFADLVAERSGRIVAYCKSGMRSSLLWGASAVAHGHSLEEVLAAARRAGQDLDPVGEIIVALGRSAQR